MITFEQVASYCEITVDELVSDLDSGSIIKYLSEYHIHDKTLINYKKNSIKFYVLKYIHKYYN